MTGFGKSMFELPNNKINVEIKTLNSKQFDLTLRIPSIYREKEIELRNLLSTRLTRGKIDVIITVESTTADGITKFNLPIIEDYYLQLRDISEKLGITETSDYIKIILSLPDSLVSQQPQLDESEWSTVESALNDAINDIDEFRSREGKILEDDIIKRANIILDLLQQIEQFEFQRIEKIKKRIRENFEEIFGNAGIDENRFEQELIYYIEKIDFTEEKVRLKNHIDYFFETLKDDDSVGKKLGFITQEIGREINTLGSKANDADIQKIVIQMKDELEKIKEQSLNVL